MYIHMGKRNETCRIMKEEKQGLFAAVATAKYANISVAQFPPVLKLCNIRAALRAQTRAPSRFLMQHRRCASSSFQIGVLIYRFKFATTPARARRATAWPTTKPTTTRVRTYRVDDVHAGELYRLENNSIKDKVVARIFISSLKRFLRSKKLKPTHNNKPRQNEIPGKIRSRERGFFQHGAKLAF